MQTCVSSSNKCLGSTNAAKVGNEQVKVMCVVRNVIERTTGQCVVRDQGRRVNKGNASRRGRWRGWLYRAGKATRTAMVWCAYAAMQMRKRVCKINDNGCGGHKCAGVCVRASPCAFGNNGNGDSQNVACNVWGNVKMSCTPWVVKCNATQVPNRTARYRATTNVTLIRDGTNECSEIELQCNASAIKMVQQQQHGINFIVVTT